MASKFAKVTGLGWAGGDSFFYRHARERTGSRRARDELTTKRARVQRLTARKATATYAGVQVTAGDQARAPAPGVQDTAGDQERDRGDQEGREQTALSGQQTPVQAARGRRTTALAQAECRCEEIRLGNTPYAEN